MFRPLISLIALIGLAGTAQAAYVPATWTDSIGTDVYLGAGQSLHYSHDITSAGFNVGNDIVTNFLLTIDLFDDRNDKWYELEAAFIDLPGYIGDGFATSFTFGDNAYAGWSIAGLFELNLLGTLTVTITSIYGDFMFGGSDLVANGYAASVPEPSTLGLLGIGLLGIAAASARRRKASRH